MSICRFIKNIFKMTEVHSAASDKELKAAATMKPEFQAVVIPGPQSDPKRVSVRRSVGWPKDTVFSEMQAAQNYLNGTNRSSWKLETRKQAGPIDIAARSPSRVGQEDIQIVRLWEPDVWENLNTKGEAERTYSDQEVIDLFDNALEKKGKRYSPDDKKKLTLLIDAYPVVNVLPFLAGLERSIEPLARRAGYDRVVVVGTVDFLKLA